MSRDVTSSFVALLYSIVLAPGRRVVMAELRAMAAELGRGAPRTLVATGNLVFEAEGDARALEARLERAFAARFGKHIDIIVRDADGWRGLVAGNPFPRASAARPAQVAVRVMRAPLDPGFAASLEPYRAGRERIAVV
ncbi:MAG TPA: DUF1697 domain-containing protein, partial [Thermoanaerobaculia bacterium]|nr:DUF1697 domain-containing protein [Thermoanaerobaculia bacterium]